MKKKNSLQIRWVIFIRPCEFIDMTLTMLPSMERSRKIINKSPGINKTITYCTLQVYGRVS